ncbi:hypothetical protein OAA09_01495 [bacterium]|nr:hypothetical protein [bacterium]
MVVVKGLLIIWGIAAVLTFCAWGFVQLLKDITLFFTRTKEG